MQHATTDDIAALELLAIELQLARAVSVTPKKASRTVSAVRLKESVPDRVLTAPTNGA